MAAIGGRHVRQRAVQDRRRRAFRLQRPGARGDAARQAARRPDRPRQRRWPPAGYSGGQLLVAS